MKKNEYQCAECGGVFEKGQTNEEAWKEYDENFPEGSHETAEIICDDCYKKMIAIEPPPGLSSSQTEQKVGWGDEQDQKKEKPVNYKKLLEKYMRAVLIEEGTAFIWDAWDRFYDYTEKEHAVLVELRDKIEREKL